MRLPKEKRFNKKNFKLFRIQKNCFITSLNIQRKEGKRNREDGNIELYEESQFIHSV